MYLIKKIIKEQDVINSAIDIGAGDCFISNFLYKNGIGCVYAIDSSLGTCADGVHSVKSKFEEFEPTDKRFDLVILRNVLPFVHMDQLGNFFQKAVNLMSEQGFLYVTFFGLEDEWAGNKNMAFMTEVDILKLIERSGLDIYYQTEEKGIGSTMSGNKKYWHIYRYILRRN